jgi:hypothetical protein
MGKQTIAEIEERIKFTEDEINRTLSNENGNTSYGKFLSLKHLKSLMAKLESLKSQRANLGTGEILVKVTGEYKNIKNLELGKIAVPKQFTIYYTGITVEDARTLVKEKLTYINDKTINIETIKLGENTKSKNN